MFESDQTITNFPVHFACMYRSYSHKLLQFTTPTNCCWLYRCFPYATPPNCAPTKVLNSTAVYAGTFLSAMIARRCHSQTTPSWSRPSWMPQGRKWRPHLLPLPHRAPWPLTATMTWTCLPLPWLLPSSKLSGRCDSKRYGALAARCMQLDARMCFLRATIPTILHVSTGSHNTCTWQGKRQHCSMQQHHSMQQHRSMRSVFIRLACKPDPAPVA